MQVGLQGVDNGSLRFTGARVPRDALLDRFGTVDASGKYRCGHACAAASELHLCTTLVAPVHAPLPPWLDPWKHTHVTAMSCSANRLPKTIAARRRTQGRGRGGSVPGHTRAPGSLPADRPSAWRRSPFSMNRRFAATLGELTGGRVGLCCSSCAILKVREAILAWAGAGRLCRRQAVHAMQPRQSHAKVTHAAGCQHDHVQSQLSLPGAQPCARLCGWCTGGVAPWLPWRHASSHEHHTAAHWSMAAPAHHAPGCRAR